MVLGPKIIEVFTNLPNREWDVDLNLEVAQIQFGGQDDANSSFCALRSCIHDPLVGRMIPLSLR